MINIVVEQPLNTSMKVIFSYFVLPFPFMLSPFPNEEKAVVTISDVIKVFVIDVDRVLWCNHLIS
jgi:hypothetical protein